MAELRAALLTLVPVVEAGAASLERLFAQLGDAAGAATKALQQVATPPNNPPDNGAAGNPPANTPTQDNGVAELVSLVQGLLSIAQSILKTVDTSQKGGNPAQPGAPAPAPPGGSGDIASVLQALLKGLVAPKKDDKDDKKEKSGGGIAGLISVIQGLLKGGPSGGVKALSGVIGGVGGGGGAGGGAGGGGGAAGAGAVAGLAGGAIMALVDAVKSAIGFLMDLPSKLAPFVEAFNPQAVELFNYALETVQATIGQALEPFFTIMRDMLMQVADIIAPAFEGLREGYAALTQSLANAVIPLVRALVAFNLATQPITKALLPLADLIAAWVGGLGPLITVVGVLLTSLVEFGLGLMGGADGIKSAVDYMIAAINTFVVSAVSAAARLLKLFGADQTLKKLRDAFKPEEKGAAKPPAAKDFGIGNLESILQQQAIDAFKGASGDEEHKDPTLKVTEDIYRAVDDIYKEMSKSKSEQAVEVAAAVTDPLGLSSYLLRLLGVNRGDG